MRRMRAILWCAACVSAFAAVVVLGEPARRDAPAQEVVVEVLQCFKQLQESGKRIYVTYIGNTMRLFDVDGEEVSCDATKQQRLREKSDRRCIFSPIHCLFNKRIQTAKMLAQMRDAAATSPKAKLYGVRRRR